MAALVSILGIVALAFLAWTLLRRFGSDRIAALNDKRRSTSRIVSPGEFVDGNRHVSVALAMTKSTLFYENREMRANIDLGFIREIEYDNDLATGVTVVGGKVLRMRSHNQTFEFVLPNDVLARWHMLLPPRRTMASLAAEVAQ
jgi:hypothetical protein